MCICQMFQDLSLTLLTSSASCPGNWLFRKADGSPGMDASRAYCSGISYFFSKEGRQLGNKKSLKQHIRGITGIPVKVLEGSPLSHFSVTERILWAEKRETTRKEDKAYSLLGIFSENNSGDL